MKGKWWQAHDGIGLSGMSLVAIVVAGVMVLVIFLVAFSLFSSPGCGCIEVIHKNINVDVQRVNETSIYVKIIDGSDVAGLIHSEAPGRGCINVTGLYGPEISNYVEAGDFICSDTAGSMQYFAVPAGTNVAVIASFKDGWQQIVWYQKVI